MTSMLAQAARPLAEFFRTVSYTPQGLETVLGDAGLRALHRGDPAGVRFALAARIGKAKDARLGDVVRLFALHEHCAPSALRELFGEQLYDVLVQSDILVPVTPDSGAGEDALLRVDFDIRPHMFADRETWVFSDRDASIVYQHVPGEDHVLGVGAASLSLISVTPSTPVDSLLDLGTGSGVQVLGQLGAARKIVATDVHPRALDLAKATLTASAGEMMDGGVIELREGSWFEPVAGERFDRVVANPPFVVGVGEVGHVYRDSGLDLDGATQKVLGELPDVLTAGGEAYVLGAWVHTDAQPASTRIASWLPSHGARVWVLERDVVDPSTYVHTWLKDESIDPRSPEGQRRAAAWLEHFAAAGVEAIGFGYIFVKRIGDDEPSELVVEEFTQHFEGNLGAEVQEHFLRSEWLHHVDADTLLDAQYALRPGLALEEVGLASVGGSDEVEPDSAQDPGASVDATVTPNMGFAPEVVRITRTEGPRWSHEIDQSMKRILSGLHPDGLSLREVAVLFALSEGLDPDAVEQALVPMMADLVRHGMVLPAELLTVESE